jgi:hypothetical protein
MNRFSRAGNAAGAVILVTLPSSTWAVCNAGPSNTVLHSFGGRFENCPDSNPVAAFIYTRGSAATINSGATDVACGSIGGTSQTVGCAITGDPGNAGEGNVTILFDYGNPETQGPHPGCPNSGLIATPPRQVIQVVANDGSSLLVTVGWNRDLG